MKLKSDYVSRWDMPDANIIQHSDGQYCNDWSPDEIHNLLEHYKTLDGDHGTRKRLYLDYMNEEFPHRLKQYREKYGHEAHA